MFAYLFEKVKAKRFQYLFKEGDLSDCCYVLVKGSVKFLCSSSQQTLVVEGNKSSKQITNKIFEDENMMEVSGNTSFGLEDFKQYCAFLAKIKSVGGSRRKK